MDNKELSIIKMTWITEEYYMQDIKTIQGKTIGVIYTYEGENAPGFRHYHIWESDIIAQWLVAIQQIRCKPFILDVRTFVEKAIAGTLPKLDYVINLNCGGCELSPMALIPSLCAFFHIPCIPCNAVSILTGENKYISNLLAQSIGLNVPKTLLPSDTEGIFRPLNLGSSLGIKRGPLSGQEPEGLYQEFIKGYDITTPIVYNPLTKKMDFLPTVIYVSQEETVEWYLGEEHKETRSGFIRKTIYDINDDVKKLYLDLIKSMSISTFCRIDARVKCFDNDKLAEVLNSPLKADDLYFIEINPMPTVWVNNAFSHSFSQINEKSTFYPYINSLKELAEDANVYSFLLSASMLSFYNQVKK